MLFSINQILSFPIYFIFITKVNVILMLFNVALQIVIAAFQTSAQSVHYL